MGNLAKPLGVICLIAAAAYAVRDKLEGPTETDDALHKAFVEFASGCAENWGPIVGQLRAGKLTTDRAWIEAIEKGRREAQKAAFAGTEEKPAAVAKRLDEATTPKFDAERAAVATEELIRGARKVR